MRSFNCFIALLLSLIFSVLQAQNNYSFVFHKDGKAILVIPSNEIDSITFSANDIDPNPEPVTPQPQVYDECPDSNHPHLIDLGLPRGIKWACCNVNATNPGEYGSHFAWGETETKEYYSPDTYTVDGASLGSSIKATNYDVAYVKWGAAWCIPSLADCQELVDNCTWTWEQYGDDGNYGIRVTGKNGNSIFLPAGGFPNWGGWNRVGSYGTYWTSTHASGSQSYYFRFDSSYFETTSWDGEQYVGQLVRPVNYSNTTPDPDPQPEPNPEPLTPDDRMVDLGLSVKWASYNVGATKPGETGNYYRWAETEAATEFYFVHKVSVNDDTVPICISGTEYDVARKEWGALWRIPTGEEMEELVSKCTWTWTYSDGHFGARVTGPNGNSIFLPAAGYYPNSGASKEAAGRLNDLDLLGRYTTGNDLFKGNGWHQIQYAELDDVGAKMISDYWDLAIPVRPVYGDTTWTLTPRSERNNLGQIDWYGEFETWKRHENWGSFYLPFKWEGVKLNESGNVVALELENNNLGRVIDIKHLPMLQKLSLSHNSNLNGIEIENSPLLNSLILDDVPSLYSLTVDSLPHVEFSDYGKEVRFSGIYDNLILHQGELIEQNVFYYAQVKNLTLENVTFKTHFRPEVQTLTLRGTSFVQDAWLGDDWTAKVTERFECHDSNIDYIVQPSSFTDGCEMIFDNTTIRISRNTVKTLNCTFSYSIDNWIKYVVE